MKTKFLWVCLLLYSAAILFLHGCATQSVNILPAKPPGFLAGLLHGFIVLFSFIVGLFTEYRIYAFPNAGGWYDFGFLLGVMFFFGGSGAGGPQIKVINAKMVFQTAACAKLIIKNKFQMKKK